MLLKLAVSPLFTIFLSSIATDVSFARRKFFDCVGNSAAGNRVSRQRADRDGRAAILHNLLAIIGSAHIAERVAFAWRDLSMGWLAINHAVDPRYFALPFYIVLPKLRSDEAMGH